MMLLVAHLVAIAACASAAANTTTRDIEVHRARMHDLAGLCDFRVCNFTASACHRCGRSCLLSPERAIGDKVHDCLFSEDMATACKSADVCLDVCYGAIATEKVSVARS